jgi:hypothetical protein
MLPPMSQFKTGMEGGPFESIRRIGHNPLLTRSRNEGLQRVESSFSFAIDVWSEDFETLAGRFSGTFDEGIANVIAAG